MSIVVNLSKAKNIAHEMRRKLREDEFAPLDEKIMKQIPGIDVNQVEAERQAIRDKYSLMQVSIDNASSTEQLKNILSVK